MSFKDWKEVALGDIVDVISGGTPKTSVNEYWEPDEIDWITAKDVSECENRTIRKTSRRISNQGLKNSAARILEPLTTVLIARGATTGKVALSSEGMAMNQTCYGLQAKKGNDKLFIYYLMLSRYNSFKAIANGSIFETVIGSGIKSIKVNVPSFPIQQSIGKILGAIDDKIELNNTINKNLEEMAQALFKRWFVDFEFPNENGEPYKSSGGEFEESELGLIPKGWRIQRLKELSEVITKGTTPTTLGKRFTDTGINFIKAESISDNHSFDHNKFAYIDEETYGLLKRSVIKKDDILFTIAGTLGRFAIVPESVLPANTNQAVAIIRVNSLLLHPIFVYCFLLSGQHNAFYTERIQQAVQANLSLKTIGELPLIVPEKHTLYEFERSVITLLSKKQNLQEQNNLLMNIRDSLLPKLMSGEIRVPIEIDDVQVTDLSLVSENKAQYSTT